MINNFTISLSLSLQKKKFFSCFSETTKRKTKNKSSSLKNKTERKKSKRKNLNRRT